MKPKPPASDYQRHQANLRKAKPVRRLSPTEIAALEHAMNLTRFLRKHSDR